MLSCLAAIFFALASPAPGQSDRDATAAIASALQAKEFDRALALLQPALQQSPNNPKLWTLRALGLAGKGDSKGALAAYRTALQNSPEYVPALEGAAQIEYEAGAQSAVPLLKDLLRLRPNNPTTHAMLAVLAEKRDDCTQAIEHFALVGPLLDSQPALRDEYATCLLKLKQTEKAISLYEVAVEHNPTDQGLRHRLAALHLMAEQPLKALDSLAPLLQAGSPDVRTLELAASAYEAAHNTQMAVGTLHQAILQDPHNVDLYLDFTLISMDHQSYDVGVDMLNVGIQAEPNAAPLYVARGVLYVQLANYEKAEDDFEKAEKLEPNQGIAAVAKGLEQVQADDAKRALATVRAKLSTAPNDPYLLYLQADILAQLGPDPGTASFQAAVRSARRAIALRPSLVPARDVLAKLYLEAGQNEAAIMQCRQALNVDPKDQTALYHLIQALRKEGARQELPDLLKRLAELRAESTKQEVEHNRFKLVEESPAVPHSQR